MTNPTEALGKLRAADPVPETDRVHGDDDAAALFSSILRRRDEMDTRPHTERTRRQQPDARPRRLAFIFASAAAVVVLAIGVPLLLLQGGDTPGEGPVTTKQTVTTTTADVTTTAGVTTTDAVTTTTPLTEVPSPEPAPITTGWSKVPYDFDVFGPGIDGLMSSVTLGGPGLVAVGYSCSDLVDNNFVCEAAAWVSADGVEWQRAPGGKDLFGAGALSLTDVAAGPSGVVAVTECSGDGNLSALCDPGMWFSPDGMTWDPVEMSSEVFQGCSTSGSPRNCVTYWNTIVPGGPGFVAAGKDLRGPGIWASADGRDWSRVAGPDLFPDEEGFFEIWDLAAVGSRIVAFGELDVDVFNENGEWIDLTSSAYLWTSLDGINWEPVPDPDEVLISGTIDSAVVWDGGLAATGRACFEGETCDVAWLSPDGLTWSYTRLPGVEAGMWIRGVIAGETGLIVWGESGHSESSSGNPVGYFWTSSDGTTWQRHTAHAEVFGDGLPIWDLVWYDGVLVGVGSNPIDRAPAIYRWNP